MSDPTPLNEPRRLAAIAASDLLDTGALPALDRVVRTVARLLGAPVAQLNVVTADRQIPVSHVGGDAWGGAVGLDRSYCQHVIRGGEPLVVEDAREHPLVSASAATRESGIVGYLSVPIVSPRAEAPLGTLCVVDFRPRAWTEHDIQILTDLSAWALSEIELRAVALRDHARAEEALRASDARYRALFDSLDEGFCVVGLRFEGEHAVDYRYLETNAAFEGQTGLREVNGRWASEMVEPIGGERATTYGRVARTGEPTRFETYVDALGRWFDVYAFSTGVEGEVAVLFRDISAARQAAEERERLLAAIEVERARLEQVFRRAPSFVVAYRGPEQVYDFVNEAYYQLVGHRELLGKPLEEALPEIRGQGFKELLERVRQSGEPWVGRATPVELQRTPGGPTETRYLDMVFQALTEPDGTRSGVVAHGSDVTEQVLARREVERLLVESERARADAEAARAEAEGANRAKAEFLATMSHELRTPLNAIGGYAELLEMGIRGPVTDLQRDDLSRIQQSQRHLLGLINEVLNYAKLETGTIRYDIGDVPVGEALAAAHSLVAPQARAKGITLSIAPGAPATLTARADPEKLRQILVNLVGNAVKFTLDGGRVEMSCAAEGGRVVFRVRDTGIGIPREKLETIFDPFVQVRSDLTRPHEGTGLGLAISRDLARAMGGDLRAESELGQGSTLTLTLPAS